ncbi:MAG: ComF family protein [Candidatus Hydrogenedentes bacterium]|nr:ComF family protein [Candidatus Hydrogenedentota bacterium]
MAEARAARVRGALGPWWLAFKNLCFPIFCQACRVRLLTEENGYYCPTCWELARRVEAPFCTRCGRPHEAMVGLGQRRNFPCARCRERPPEGVGRIYGAVVYEGVAAEAIKHFKFHGKHRLARPLGLWLQQFAAEYIDTGAYDLLVPVPLHRVRLRERGFNQSALLAEFALPAFPGARLCEDLKRIRPTRTQSTLTGKERRDNVRGAFAVEGEGMSGRSILLIDDVVTSGGTVQECGKAVRRAGAIRADVLAVALARRWR